MHSNFGIKLDGVQVYMVLAESIEFAKQLLKMIFLLKGLNPDLVIDDNIDKKDLSEEENLNISETIETFNSYMRICWVTRQELNPNFPDDIFTEEFINWISLM